MSDFAIRRSPDREQRLRRRYDELTLLRERIDTALEQGERGELPEAVLAALVREANEIIDRAEAMTSPGDRPPVRQ